MYCIMIVSTVEMVVQKMLIKPCLTENFFVFFWISASLWCQESAFRLVFADFGIKGTTIVCDFICFYLLPLYQPDLNEAVFIFSNIQSERMTNYPTNKNKIGLVRLNQERD